MVLLHFHSMKSVRIENVQKKFDKTFALQNINLTIESGELFFLLGPSGCGKSTLLRLIAGLHSPTKGKVFFNDEDVTRKGTETRNAVMCFQSYALWPHMTVRENVQFGLDVRGFSKTEATRYTDEMLQLVQMDKFADRKPNQLSGGQQQRVALARALAVKPDCLLLDEPLSNLDAKLRHEMRNEIRRICKAAKITTIYVTHDQKEALSIADRIAVLKDGRIIQIGSPSELYHSPASSFIAEFVGATNLLKGHLAADGLIDTRLGRITAKHIPAGMHAGTEVILSIRPEHIRVQRGHPNPQNNQHFGTIVDSAFVGEASELTLNVHNQKITMIHSPPIFDPPAELPIEFSAHDVVVLSE